MEKQTAKLEGAIKTEGEQVGPKIEVKRQREWFQTPKEKREEKERLALTKHPDKGILREIGVGFFYIFGYFEWFLEQIVKVRV